MKLSEAFVSIVVIRIHTSAIGKYSRSPRGMRKTSSQVIQSRSGEWEAAVVSVYRRFGGVGIFKIRLILQAIPNSLDVGEVYGGPRRGVMMLKYNDFLLNYREYNILPNGRIIYNENNLFI